VLILVAALATTPSIADRENFVRWARCEYVAGVFTYAQMKLVTGADWPHWYALLTENGTADCPWDAFR